MKMTNHLLQNRLSLLEELSIELIKANVRRSNPTHWLVFYFTIKNDKCTIVER